MMRTFLLVALTLGLLLSASMPVSAMSTQFGDTGLLSQPIATTLNEGNICMGLWGNCTASSGDLDDATVVPVTLTMGLGTFMETYGSYPNLLFNGDEDDSGRGYANVGFKFRVFGKRSDPFRVGFDLHARRSISDTPVRDGLTDYGSRLIASFNTKTFGLHANVGYLQNESPRFIDYDDQYTLGAALEYFPINRLRLVAEASYETEKERKKGDLGEATVGFQYFVTPHLTMNLGTSVGYTDGGPDWRALFGFTTCQGVGTFNRPVPKLVAPLDEIEAEEAAKPVKIVKIRTLTPLIPRIGAASSPVSHLEIPVKQAGEEVVVDPADRLKMPIVARLDAPAVSPIVAPAPRSKPRPLSGPIDTRVLRKFRFPEFTFNFDQFNLSAEGETSLALVAEELRKEDRYFIVSIEGHTDNVGPEGYNQNLSFERAVTAASYLVLHHGLDPARVFVKGHGENQPIGDNKTEEGKAKNRRVELLVLMPKTDKLPSPETSRSSGRGKSETQGPPTQKNPDRVLKLKPKTAQAETTLPAVVTKNTVKELAEEVVMNHDLDSIAAVTVGTPEQSPPDLSLRGFVR